MEDVLHRYHDQLNDLFQLAHTGFLHEMVQLEGVAAQISGIIDIDFFWQEIANLGGVEAFEICQMSLDFRVKLVICSDGLFMLSVKDTRYIILKIKPPNPESSIGEQILSTEYTFLFEI